MSINYYKTLQLYLENHKGFSLVELSIVLVILGLLTGGILTGKNLIDAAKTRSQIINLEEYQTALHSFKIKYLAFPGDMTNAEMFWPGKQ